MYQLYMCFMITDPKTTTHKVWSQCLVAGLVAVAEMCFRLAPTWFSRAPEFLSFDAAYLALFVVGPMASLDEKFGGTLGKASRGATGAVKAPPL